MYKVIGADGRQYGPVTADEIRRWIRERRLNNQSLIQAGGETSWKPLSFFTEFATDVVNLPPPAPPAAAAANNMAVASFVTGIVSVACCSGCIIFSVLGIVFGSVALSQMKQNPNEGGKALAISGIVLSIIGLLLGVIGISVGAIGHALDFRH